MTRMLIAGVLSALLVIAIGNMFIAWLRRNEFGQQFREDGPESHVVTKSGTPIMGGLLIFAAMTPPYFLIGRDHTAYGTIVWVTMMMCALIGFIDDWMKINNRRSLGLSGWRKMGALVVVAAFLGWSTTTVLEAPKIVAVPFVSTNIDLSWAGGIPYYVLLFLIVAGFSNAVNLTDGLDGLAGSMMVIALLCYTGISAFVFILFDRGFGAVEEPAISGMASLDIAIFSSALAGACAGFLWYNEFPARVFMGDTGSMGLGGAFAALGIVTKNELLTLIIGGVFVVEAMSVIMQVASFKTTGKRIFLMAPIHHHFEQKGWSETQIMMRFAIVAGLFAATAFTVWFRTH